MKAWIGMMLVTLPVLPACLAAETPSGTRPAVPGGGNPHAVSDKAATPAVPGGKHDKQPDDKWDRRKIARLPRWQVTFDTLDHEERQAFCRQNKDLRKRAGKIWGKLTPEQKRAFRHAHPGVKRNVAAMGWKKLSPAERGTFLVYHPELAFKLHQRWNRQPPRQREKFCHGHPRLARHAKGLKRGWQKHGAQDRGVGQGRAAVRDRAKHRAHDKQKVRRHRRAHQDRGVRDHGAGQGRNKVGQGGQRRHRAGGSKPAPRRRKR